MTPMRVELAVQFASRSRAVPSAAQLRGWVRAALHGRRRRAALGLRVVDNAEGTRLNRRWRGKDRPTNVLSFPCAEAGTAPEWLGDIVLCAPVVNREAREQGKARAAHWAHLTVHGTLHLLGFDHDVAARAAVMERRERNVLAGLGFADPYAPAGRR